MVSSLNAQHSFPNEQYCYLTTTGRISQKPHTVELWYASSPQKATIYILAGGRERADWVRNIGKDPHVSVRAKGVIRAGVGRIVESGEEELQARKLVVAKYYNREYKPSGGWEAEALPVAIDLQA